MHGVKSAQAEVQKKTYFQMGLFPLLCYRICSQFNVLFFIHTGISCVNRRSSERSHLLGNPARPRAVQWYVGEGGEAALKYVFDELTQIADGNVNMSRNTDTQDISISFIHRGKEWSVKFPLNFPRSKASLSSDGEERGKIGGGTVEIAVRGMLRLLNSREPGHLSHHQRDNPTVESTVQWYASDDGEADLKYVFNELTRLVNGEVKMRRNTDTQDIALNFEYQGQIWQIKFPANFPKSKANLIRDGDEEGKFGGENVKVAVRAIVNRITSLKQPSAEMFVLPARTGMVQWYSGGEGEAHLKYVFEEMMKIADGEVKMSRDKDIQDVTLSFNRQGQAWQIQFPSDFPVSSVSLTSDGEDCGKVGGNTVESATIAITNRITGHCFGNEGGAGTFEEQARRATIQWYAGEQGEAALKYVFDELRQLADDGVQMSRKIDTQDVTLRFKRHAQQWQVKFPSNFPNSDARLIFNGDVYAVVGSDTFETAVRTIKYHISSADQPGATTVHWKSISCVTH